MARIPEVGENRILMLSIFQRSPKELCVRVVKGGWYGEPCRSEVKGPLRYSRNNKDGTELFDLYSVYPSAQVGVLGLGYQESQVIFANEVIERMEDAGDSGDSARTGSGLDS